MSVVILFFLYLVDWWENPPLLQKTGKKLGFCHLSFKNNETIVKNVNDLLARPRDNSSKCHRYLSHDDPQGTICTGVKEISNEYQEGTFTSKKRTFYENNSEVSDGPQRKNAKQVASKKKSKSKKDYRQLVGTLFRK